jgi:hypothetical protein
LPNAIAIAIAIADPVTLGFRFDDKLSNYRL